MNFSAVLQNLKIQLLAVSLLVVYTLKVFIGTKDSVLLLVLSDICLIIAGTMMMLYLIPYVRKLKIDPVQFIAGAGGVGFVILYWGLDVLGMLNGGKFEYLNASPFILSMNFFIEIVLLSATICILIGFSELFFLKQKRNLKTHYNSMIIFILLTSATAVLNRYENLRFINVAITVNAVILVSYNSLRITWIAFLSKKQKTRLLLISVSLIVMFSFAVASISDDESKKWLSEFSDALIQFVLVMNIYGIIYFVILFFTTLFHLPTAEAFDRKSKEISSLQNFSKLMNQMFDFKELASTATEMAANICNGDAAWIVIRNGKNLTTMAPKNIGYLSAENIFNQIKHSALSDRTSTVRINSLLQMNAEKNEDTFAYAAVAPLRSHKSMNGYLIITKKGEVPFDEEDKNTLETFADYVAIAIENSKLLVESIEKERLEKELDVAREMQKKLIPSQIPKVKNLEISAAFIPAFEVGGDYYDFFEFNDHTLGFVIADVSGKGISAAFVMAEIRGVFESLTGILTRPKDVLDKANRILQRTLDKKSFISAVYGIIDTNTGEVFMCRAGHPPVLLLRRDTVEEITPKGIALGLNYSALFPESLEEYHFQLEDDDILLFYTDGITEAKNVRSEDFSIGNLKQILASEGKKNTSEIAESILSAISVYSQDTPQHDDISLIIFKWKKT